MAVGKSGYIDVTIMPQSVGKVRVYWREDYDAVNNYSKITITDVQGYLWHRSGWAKVALKVTAGDVTVMNSSGQWMFSANADTTLRSVVSTSDYTVGFSEVTSDPIYHDDDGSKTITITFTLLDCIISSVGFNATDNQSASATVALTAIPRASAISATDANIEAVSSIVVNRKSSAYTHSIHYQFGDLSGYINADGSVSSSEVKLSEISIGFTIPTDFYAQIPNSKTGTCTLTVTTYSGSTQIGDAKICTFAVTAAQAKCAPPVNGTVVDVNETTLALTGDENKLVRFFSNVLATIAAEAKNSASIASKSIAGQTVTGNARSIEAVETGSFAFAATDSRGYSNSVQVNKTLIPYIKLTCNVETPRVDPTSGEVWLLITGDYYNGSFGAADNALTLQYIDLNGETVTLTPVYDGNSYSVEIVLSGYDYQLSHKITVMASDKLMNLEKVSTVLRGIPVADFGENDWKFNVPVKFEDGLIIVGKSLLDYFMPVGYVYVSSDATSPAALFGGTWEQIKDRFLLAAGSSYTVGDTGGSAAVTLSIGQTPVHKHSFVGGHAFDWGEGIGNINVQNAVVAAGATSGNRLSTVQGAYDKTNNAGGGEAHDNMPPYLVVYIWRRTA